ncbi:hypothetical protein LTR39_002042 [Cryomyces antarcticus]|nr:hypothetical protein LTR39_002042 [Cryomyces antarcticus]
MAPTTRSQTRRDMRSTTSPTTRSQTRRLATLGHQGDPDIISADVHLPKRAKTSHAYERPYCRKGHFPFLKLPGEIRNKIYHLIVVARAEITVFDTDTLTPPPFTLVCKQIRAESESVFYGCNMFYCRLFDAETLILWLQSIGAARVAMLRDLSIETDPCKGLAFHMERLEEYGLSFHRELVFTEDRRIWNGYVLTRRGYKASVWGTTSVRPKWCYSACDCDAYALVGIRRDAAHA